MLELSLLGVVRARFENRPITHFYSAKTQALLCYLAVESAHPHSRAKLTGLLWPEFPQTDANRSLRQVLFQLNKSLDNPRTQLLLVSNRTVQFNKASPHWLDVAEFTSHLRQGAWQPAVDLYHGPFLDGFAVDDSPTFEEWLQNTRDAFHEKALSALAQLTAQAAAQGDHAAAQGYATQTLTHAPWREDAHRALILALALQGRRHEALAQFARCRRILEEELSVSLADETIALYERIRNGALPPPQPAPARVTGAPAQPTSIPPPRRPVARTPLVGRQSQLAQMLSRLTDPHCRLLTLVGLGGVGKTRLAQEAAQALADNEPGRTLFPDGVWFVPLLEAKTAQGGVGIVAQSLGIPLYGNQSIEEQVLHFLRAKRMLLVLDNVEHLPGAPAQIAALLDAAPEVKLLVTSQQALDLWDEWLFPVNGLALPSATDAAGEDVGQAPAVTLFCLNAQRRDPDFQSDGQSAAIARICRLVDGLPLAIELAAAWLPRMTCAQIAEQIESSLNFLATSAAHIPERHRSIRSVLDQSWALISPDEQEGLRRLAIFRGSFHAQAAQGIAQVTPSLLRQLVEITLLQAVAPERYQMHDLVRRYEEEKLLADPQDRAEVLTRYSDFFLGFIAQRQETLFQSSRGETLAEVDREFEHILSAWHWAAEHARFAPMDQAQESLFAFCLNRGRYGEGVAAFTRLIAALDAFHAAQGSDPRQDPIYGRALARQGFFAVSSGEMERGMAALNQALTITRRQGAPADIAFCLTFLGEFEGWRGHFDRARQLLHESIALNEEMGDLLGGGFALYRLGELTHTVGEFAQALAIFQRCVEISRRLDSQDALGYALDQLGYCHFLVGDWAGAEAAYGESLRLFREVGNELGVALACTGLGLTTWARGGDTPAEAESRLAESIERARRVGHPIHLAGALSVLGLVQTDQGNSAQAQAILEEGLALARQVDFGRGVITCLNGLAQLCWQRGQMEEARELLAESLALAETIGLRPLRAEVMLYQAGLLAAQGRPAPAVALLQQVVQTLPLQAVFRQRAQSLLTTLTQ